MFTADPIGYLYSPHNEKHITPRQPNLIHNEGVIILKPHYQFEQALEGLEGFDKIWVIFWFHHHRHWKPKVLPPRGKKKWGVFATRSPHRPNFIGLSCLELKAVKGRQLFVVNHDLLDGTPILDIKPYINYADSVGATRQGWLDELEDPSVFFEVNWSHKAQEQAHYILQHGKVNLVKPIVFRLQTDPFPYPNRRIKLISGNQYEIAYKSWRILYKVNLNQLEVLEIKSGYDQETLKGQKQSQWDDIYIHQSFTQQFNL